MRVARKKKQSCSLILVQENGKDYVVWAVHAIIVRDSIGITIFSHSSHFLKEKKRFEQCTYYTLFSIRIVSHRKMKLLELFSGISLQSARCT